jgi:hypothetical protein
METKSSGQRLASPRKSSLIVLLNVGVLFSCVFAAGTALTAGPTGAAGVWSLTGNAKTAAGTNFLGTTDNQPLEIHVNGARVTRYELAITNSIDTSPNVISGDAGNHVSSGVQGSTNSGRGWYHQWCLRTECRSGRLRNRGRRSEQPSQQQLFDGCGGIR